MLSHPAFDALVDGFNAQCADTFYSVGLNDPPEAQRSLNDARVAQQGLKAFLQFLLDAVHQGEALEDARKREEQQRKLKEENPDEHDPL